MLLERGMATRSEQFRADQEREAALAHHQAEEDKKAPPHHEEATHLAKKAVYKREEGSRKSTRKSANHAKPDAQLEHTTHMRETAPQQSYERNERRAIRVRGHGTGAS